jgi:hypothetical protein
MSIWITATAAIPSAYPVNPNASISGTMITKNVTRLAAET